MDGLSHLVTGSSGPLCTSYRDNDAVFDVIEIRCHADHSGDLHPSITCDASLRGLTRSLFAKSKTTKISGQSYANSGGSRTVAVALYAPGYRIATFSK